MSMMMPENQWYSPAIRATEPIAAYVAFDRQYQITYHVAQQLA